MSQLTTRFGSLDRWEKGGVEVIDDDPRHYVFSNVFEVASKAKPYEKVAVGKNVEYVIEAIRAEGVSAWRAPAQDEFALVMDGEVEIHLLKLADPRVVPAGTSCRAAADSCDAAETCTGTSASCPGNSFAPAGTTCRWSSRSRWVVRR